MCARRCVGIYRSEQITENRISKSAVTKTQNGSSNRCMICGQRPADDVNIQLHTHHIRPHGLRGVTTQKNLISLCHTCHAGLEPHYEYSLFGLVEKQSNPIGSSTKVALERYISSVQNYRKSIQSLLNKRNPSSQSKNKLSE